MGAQVLLSVFIIFTVSAAIQFYYYLYYYLSVHLHKRPSVIPSGAPVSVIICARNEAENLKNFLPSVLEQDYPSFEVIVVNDCSEDNSYHVLGKLLTKYDNLKVSSINKDPRFTHNKKFAQFIGIKAAKNEILLFTDADCRPKTGKWIEGMVSRFDDNVNFVLGYGGYMRDKGLLNTYIRYDSFTIAMQYIGMTLRGNPYMGIGRNMAYRRSVFFANNGFKSHTHLASGDDDLFVNRNARENDTIVEFSKETHTLSVPLSGVRQWIAQKRRHLTTAPYYKLKDKWLLITEPLSRVIFYISFIFLMGSGFLIIPAIAIFSSRMLLQGTVISMVQKKLDERGLVAYSVIFDILSPFINGILYLVNTLGKTKNNEWR